MPRPYNTHRCFGLTDWWLCRRELTFSVQGLEFKVRSSYARDYKSVQPQNRIDMLDGCLIERLLCLYVLCSLNGCFQCSSSSQYLIVEPGDAILGKQ